MRYIPSLLQKNRDGSALLIALIIMGILLTIAIGVSELLIRSVRDSKQLIDRTKAWYRAEAGIETALVKVTRNPPGYEEKEERNNTNNFGYSISAAATTVPELPYPEASDAESFSELLMGQTVSIPLFSGTNPAQGITRFKLVYKIEPKLKIEGGRLPEALDILRWKIFGRTLDGTQTEVINEIAPERGELSCVGTEISECYPTGKYYKQSGENDELQFIEKEFISNFLESHTQNFLVITNMVNVDLIGGTLGKKTKQKLASIWYKVIQLDDQTSDRLTLPTVTVTADGYEKNTKQSIDLEINRERALPVFNYALYRTE